MLLKKLIFSVETLARANVSKVMIQQRFPDIIPVVQQFNHHMLKNPVERAFTSCVRISPPKRLTCSVEKELVRLATDLIIECQTHHNLERIQENAPHISIIRRLKVLTSFALSKYDVFSELLVKHAEGKKSEMWQCFL